MTKMAVIMQEALKLTPKKRGEMLDRLFTSLDGPNDHLTPAQWIKEVRRRVAEARSGKGKSKPLAQVITEVRKKYDL